MTRRPLAVRSDVVKELYSEPKIVKQGSATYFFVRNAVASFC